MRRVYALRGAVERAVVSARGALRLFDARASDSRRVNLCEPWLTESCLERECVEVLTSAAHRKSYMAR